MAYLLKSFIGNLRQPFQLRPFEDKDFVLNFRVEPLDADKAPGVRDPAIDPELPLAQTRQWRWSIIHCRVAYLARALGCDRQCSWAVAKAWLQRPGMCCPGCGLLTMPRSEWLAHVDLAAARALPTIEEGAVVWRDALTGEPVLGDGETTAEVVLPLSAYDYLEEGLQYGAPYAGAGPIDPWDVVSAFVGRTVDAWCTRAVADVLQEGHGVGRTSEIVDCTRPLAWALAACQTVSAIQGFHVQAAEQAWPASVESTTTAELLGPRVQRPCRHTLRDGLDLNHMGGSAVQYQTYPDGQLGPVPGREYRADEHAHGLRCTECWPTNLHFLAPELCALPKVGVIAPGFWRCLLDFSVATRAAVSGLPISAEVTLTAASEARAAALSCPLPGGSDATLVYTDGPLAEAVAAGKEYRFVRIKPGPWSGRGLATLRVLGAAVLPSRMLRLVVNGKYEGNFPSDMDWHPTEAEGCASFAMHAVWPGMACATAWRGQPVLSLYGGVLPQLAGQFGVYGVDEYAINTWDNPVINVRGIGPTHALMTAPKDLRHPWPSTLRFEVDRRKYLCHMAATSRATLAECVRRYRAAQKDSRPVSLWDVLTASWASKDEGQFLVHPTRDPAAVRPRSAPTSSTQGLLRRMFPTVTFLPLGSHGDMVPVEALARHLAKLGLDVNIVPLCTRQEGAALLRDLEVGRTLKGAPVYMAGLAAALATPGVTVGITEMPTCPITYSLQPPTSMIHTPRFMLGALVDAVMSRFWGAGTATFRIGSYTGPHWLPRSADGVTFLEGRAANRPRRHKEGLAWGSSSLPKPYLPGVLDVPPGPHSEIFRDYEVIHTHGGAGTVQTAAAAGCRVQVHTSVLDRDYRTPLDAGAGTYTGVDPDRVLLILGAVNPLAYVAYARKGPMHALDAAVWAGYAHLGSLLWAALVLLTLVPWRQLPVGPRWDPMASLVAGALGSTGETVIGALVIVPLVSMLLQVTLELVHVSRVEALRQVAALTFRALLDFTGMLLIGRYGLVWGSVIYWAVEQGRPVWRGLVAMLAHLMSLRSAEGMEGGAILRLTFSLAGLTPIIHSSLLSPDRQLVYELRFAPGGGFFGDEAVVKIWPTKPSNLWHLDFPTALSWSAVERLPRTRGAYSVFFNCQTALVANLRHGVALLGVGGLLLYMTSALAALTIVLGLAILAIPIAFVALVPDSWHGLLRPDEAAAIETAVVTVERWVRVLFNSSDPLFKRLVTLVNAPMVGFGSVEGPAPGLPVPGSLIQEVPQMTDALIALHRGTDPGPLWGLWHPTRDWARWLLKAILDSLEGDEEATARALIAANARAATAANLGVGEPYPIAIRGGTDVGMIGPAEKRSRHVGTLVAELTVPDGHAGSLALVDAACRRVFAWDADTILSLEDLDGADLEWLPASTKEAAASAEEFQARLNAVCGRWLHMPMATVLLAQAVGDYSDLSELLPGSQVRLTSLCDALDRGQAGPDRLLLACQLLAYLEDHPDIREVPVFTALALFLAYNAATGTVLLASEAAEGRAPAMHLKGGADEPLRLAMMLVVMAAVGAVEDEAIPDECWPTERAPGYPERIHVALHAHKAWALAREPMPVRRLWLFWRRFTGDLWHVG